MNKKKKKKTKKKKKKKKKKRRRCSCVMHSLTLFRHGKFVDTCCKKTNSTNALTHYE
jgi:ABC-type polar amino acid transport system ATPase subunit